MFCVYVCMCVDHMFAWCLQRSGRVSDSLELKLQVIVSHHEGTENRTTVLCKKYFDHRGMPPLLCLFIVKLVRCPFFISAVFPPESSTALENLFLDKP